MHIRAFVLAVLATACARSPRRADPGECPRGDATVRLTTSRGVVDVEVHQGWAPHAARRFLELVEARYYDGDRFYRVVPGFAAQTGVHPDPAVTALWNGRTIPDDPPKAPNRRGTVSLGRSAAPDSATTQLYVLTAHLPHLDGQGFAPLGCVSRGMDVIDGLYAGYGEVYPVGTGPEQARVMAEGEAYLARDFPLLDRVIEARAR